jgi:hypothetical protein
MKKEWEQSGRGWIRVGCKIYDIQQCHNIPLTELKQDLPKSIKKGEKFQVVFYISKGFLPRDKCLIKFDIVNEQQF